MKWRICVLSDLTAGEEGQVSILTLLDLSTLFDTIDHEILLNRLEHTFGIPGSALSFLKSYISDRNQIVSIFSHTSSATALHFGIPQGSVRDGTAKL